MTERQVSLGFSLVKRGYTRTVPSGRFISENAIPPAVLAESGVPMEYVPSPYPDHRFGYPHNKSALEEIRREWNSRLAGLSWIRKRFYNGNEPIQASIGELDQMAHIACVMPHFMENRAENPYSVQGEIPDQIGDLTKLAAGMVTATRKLKDDGFRSDDRNLTGERAYHYIDRNQLLLGSDRYACPATPGMIKKAFDILISDSDGLPESNLEVYLPDFSSLRNFSEIYTEFLQTRTLMRQIFDRFSNQEAESLQSQVIGSILPTLQKMQNGLYQALGHNPNDLPPLNIESVQASMLE